MKNKNRKSYSQRKLVNNVLKVSTVYSKKNEITIRLIRTAFIVIR